MNDHTMCSVKQWGNEKDYTGCYKLDSGMVYLLRMFWYPSIFSFMMVLLMPFVTVIGRNAIEFIITPFFPSLKRRHVDRMLRLEVSAITDHLALEQLLDRRNDGKVEQTILKLKTKSADDASIDDDTLCLICMAPLDQTEMIGDLSCGHSYHVDCLKEWLKRRNACPLCDTQVADKYTVLVDAEEAFPDDDDEETNAEVQRRFDRLLDHYNDRTTRRMLRRI